VESKPVMRLRITTLVFLLFVCLDLSFSAQIRSQENGTPTPPPAPGKLTLVAAVMCEKVDEYTPRNPAIVFSVSIGKISCFTSFDPVPEDTFVYHKWFYRDELTTRIKLSLKTPRWSTLSSIQLREADKGPWRVEVTDSDGNTLQTLRFSITD
jgi:hypothetical protein